MAVQGVEGSLRGLFAALRTLTRRAQTVAITRDATEARDLAHDAALVLRTPPLLLPEPVTRVHTSLKNLDATQGDVAEALRLLEEQPETLVIGSLDTFLRPLPPRRTIAAHTRHLVVDQPCDREELVSQLSYGGYERGEYVSGPGMFAVRGAVVDVFPAGFDVPLRVEFLDDRIERIREFDPVSQRSIRTLSETSFLTSLLLHEEDHENPSSLLDYLSLDAELLIFQEREFLQRLEDEGNDDLRASFALFPRLSINPTAVEHSLMFPIEAERQPAFNSSIEFARKTATELVERGYLVVFAAESEYLAHRLEALLREGSGEDDLSITDHAPVHELSLSQGFILHDVSLAVFVEHQIFHRTRRQKENRKSSKGFTLRDMKQLHIGDLVVHVDKGIGRFAGFHTIEVQGGIQETVKLLFADDDALFVNLNYINRLSKYASQEGQAPKLSKLGAGEWERTKARAKKRLKDIMRDLITLYAKRKVSRGFAFSSDSHWQREMEASFIYEDTPDQFKATQDVKSDMEQATPMDRLICGDVGFGKTEVALRAAFKAVLDGKQVAVLVPTTILAEQHYHTFHDRLHRYSVHVDVLSRFRTPAEQKAIATRVTEGKVDIVIGTHRMLSKDVVFKDLGLLIIDEEHRFGVSAKEKLRQLRESVDTLTLTATPIPRTLNFSLLGARDFSIMETPPQNRLPVITSIVPFEDEVLVEGIQRELGREGQVYVVNHTIQGLDALAERIRFLVPKARVSIAHGQMTGTELENVMMRFLEKKTQVLVTTKIIESGLDIPNANTIFIHHADRFGLAELYQLRGRVGRSNTQAYAYLMFNKDAKLSRTALQRLQAIEEFTDLGSGFQLAMRDLEIRGAGNLLGAEQSGFIAEIGFDLYLSMIEEAAQELRAEEFAEVFADRPTAISRPDVVIELGLNAYLPQSYVKDSTERFDLYKRMYNCADREELQELVQELVDRFGTLPEEAHHLLAVVDCRMRVTDLRFSRLTWENPVVKLAFPPEDDPLFYEHTLQPLMVWVQVNKHRAKLEQDARQVRLAVSSVPTLEAVLDLVEELRAQCLVDVESATLPQEIPT